LNSSSFFFFRNRATKASQKRIPSTRRPPLFCFYPAFFWFFFSLQKNERSRAARCHGRRCSGVVAELAEEGDSDVAASGAAAGIAVVGINYRFEPRQQCHRQSLRQGLLVLWSVVVDCLQRRLDSRRTRRTRQGRGGVD
jgi:hypothetical protein